MAWIWLAQLTTEQADELARLSERSLASFIVVLSFIALVIFYGVLNLNKSWMTIFVTKLETIGQNFKDGSNVEAQAIRENTEKISQAIVHGINELEHHLKKHDTSLDSLGSKLDKDVEITMETKELILEISKDVKNLEERIAHLETTLGQFEGLKEQLKTMIQLIAKESKKETSHENVAS